MSTLKVRAIRHDLATSDAISIGSTGDVTINQTLSMGADWTISVSGTKLVFNYNGTDVFSISSTGEIIAADDVTAFGTP